MISEQAVPVYSTSPVSELAAEISSRLESARSQIEHRFLDGGAAMLSVLDVFNQLEKVLQEISDALTEDEAKRASAELIDTGKLISGLPSAQATRRERLVQIGLFRQALADEIVSMEETLRYLRTFAMTAKITGANIPDFSGFVVEIVERILFATREVQALSEKIKALGGMIDLATRTDGADLERLEDSIPGIVTDLTRNAGAIALERQNLAAISVKVKGFAQKVQTRLASTLSSLQIGDTTRQRIEHCQAAVTIAEDHFRSTEGLRLGPDAQEYALQRVLEVVHQQLISLDSDFSRECRSIVTNIQAFTKDVDALMGLQRTMLPARGDNRPSALRAVQGGLEQARIAVDEMQGSVQEAARLSQSVGGGVNELVQSVETIQSVRADIQYMALNTNLRCSKLGEEGRAINVVTGELRIFSSRLDETAEKALSNLRNLREQAEGLATAGGTGQVDGTPELTTRIDVALSDVSHASATMDRCMEELRRCGDDVTDKVGGAVARLDFYQGVNEIIAECIKLSKPQPGRKVETAELDEALATISAAIAKNYTMKSERDVHARIFPNSTVVAAPVVLTVVEDEDLFADALF